MSLARVVLDHPECAHVLRSHHLDYCCRGGLTVVQACVGKGVDATALVDDLEAAASNDAERPSRDPRTVTTPEIVEDLHAGHRRFLQRSTLTIGPFMSKVARAHGEERPNVCELADVFAELMLLLEPHIDEHLVLGEQLARIRSLTDDFSVPLWARDGSPRSGCSEEVDNGDS